MPARVVIVGGGYSGASAAVQLVRRSTQPLAITIVEPRAEPGRGLAYATDDPDHRLNAPADRHLLDPDRPLEFVQWVAAQGLDETDPEAWLPDGRSFVRRRDFGRFVAETLQAHAALPDGSTIRHRRGLAIAAQPQGVGWRLRLADGEALDADLLLLAIGHPAPRWPACVSTAAAAHPAAVGNPFGAGQLAANARVCLLGSGLTALDLVSTLLRRSHRGPITLLSRHGLCPRPQPEVSLAPATPGAAFEAPGAALPDFIAALGHAPRLRRIVAALRDRVHGDATSGLPWHSAFAALRDAVWRIWPTLPEADKLRFVRHLKVWYDVHRFLSPPPNEAMLQAALAAGQVRVLAARVEAVDAAAGPNGPLQVGWHRRGSSVAEVEDFDAVVNCTGVDGSAATTGNPLLQSLLAAGWLQPGPAGLGFAVDPGLSAIGRDCMACSTLRVVGPPSVGACGDPIGAAFIAMQLRRVLPELLAAAVRRT